LALEVRESLGRELGTTCSVRLVVVYVEMEVRCEVCTRALVVEGSLRVSGTRLLVLSAIVVGRLQRGTLYRSDGTS